jgi:hypothetical protein
LGHLGEKEKGSAQDEQYILSFTWRFSKRLDLIRSKDVFPLLEKFKLKYGFEAFWNKEQFMLLELFKIRDRIWIRNRGSSRLWIWVKFDGILIRTPEFDDIWIRNSNLHMDGWSTHEKELRVSNLWVSRFTSRIWFELTQILTLVYLELS